jgi:hypothetical protein
VAPDPKPPIWARAAPVVPLGAGVAVGLTAQSLIWAVGVAFGLVIVGLLVVAPLIAMAEAGRGKGASESDSN